MSAPEFSRTVRVDTIGAAPRSLEIEADEAERRALARRFGMVGIERLAADMAISRGGDTINAAGTLRAAVTQSCVATGLPIGEELETPFTILFRHDDRDVAPDEEIELSEAEMDVVFYDGAMIDIGEAVAETLSLSVTPWPRAPGAEQALEEAGVKKEEEAGPFGALAGLRDALKK